MTSTRSLADAALFERDWRRAGRPVAGNLAVGAYAAAMVFGMIGDEPGRRHWIEIITIALLPHPDRFDRPTTHWRATLDALLALHLDDPRGGAEAARTRPRRTSTVPTANRSLWLPWYAAAWAEASVLADHPDREERLRVAAASLHGNDIAGAIVDRAVALHHGRTDLLGEIAHRLNAAGCTYQADRTTRLAR